MEETKFDWDAANRKHIARHKVAPDEAEQVLLSDPFDLRYDVVGGEGCWTAIGHTNDVRVLIVVWTVREEERIRVITARAAGKSARATYLRERGF